MAEYIEREALIEDISELEVSGVFTEALKNEVLKIISEQATADVTEVKHGKWEVVFDGNAKLYENMFECSVCKTTHIGHPNVGRYCPNCGAKME